MSKRKYDKGKCVTSIDELFEYPFFIFERDSFRKTYAAGWIRSFQCQVDIIISLINVCLWLRKYHKNRRNNGRVD